MSNKVLGLVMATALAVLSGCAAAAPSVPSAPATFASVQPAKVAKLLVFVVENHSLDQMRADMPYTAALGKQFALATDYRAVTHPSLPNYLAMTGGSTFAVADDGSPSSHPIGQPSVFGQALSLGRTAKLYAEGMPENCATQNSGRYAVKHNPWAYYVAGRGSCARFDVPIDELSADVAKGQLPDAGMVIPDLCNDAHDCDLSAADQWLRTHIEAVMAGPDWHKGELAIVVTADEDDHRQDNLVLTAVAHPSLHGVVVTTPLTHYSLARLYSEVLGAQPLGEAASAPSMATAFGLHLAAG